MSKMKMTQNVYLRSLERNYPLHFNEFLITEFGCREVDTMHSSLQVKKMYKRAYRDYLIDYKTFFKTSTEVSEMIDRVIEDCDKFLARKEISWRLQK